MRILVLLGLGLPVLVVSGAVAYGSIRQISTVLTAPAPVVVASPSVSENHDFVNVSQSSWALPQAPVPEVTLAPVVPAALLGASAAVLDPGPVAVPKAAKPEIEVATVADTQIVPRPRKRVDPKIVVSTVKADRLAVKPAKEAAKPAFKMPWQAGIFQ